MLSAQQQQNNQPTQVNNNPSGSTTSKKATGIVTKILDNFGFIDDSIFFSLSVVKGNTQVKVGDKVYFECSYSKNLPFNWNATIVQPISSNNLNNQPVHQQQPTLHQTSSAIHHQQQQQQRQQPSQIHNISHTQPPHLAPPSQGLSLQQQQHPYQQPLPSVVASSVAPPQSAPINPSQQPLHNTNMYHHQQQPGAGQNSGPSGYHPGYPPIQQQQNKQVPQYGGGHQPASANQTPPMFNPPSYAQHGGNVVGSSNQPTQSVTQPQTATAPQAHVDMVKIQQAVAAAAQLSQFYTPTVAGQQPGRPDSSVMNQQQHAGGSQITAGSNHHQYGGPTGGSGGGGGGGGGVGQIQYTSTPGSAFIGSQYNPAASTPVTAVTGSNQIPKKTVPGSGIGAGGHGPTNRTPGGRWDHPRDDSSQHHRFDQGGQSKIRPVGGGIQQRDDPRTAGSRFSGKSRFNDSDSRFAPVTNMKNEDRFSQNQPVYHGPSQDHFRGNNIGNTRMGGGGDLRKDQESRFNRDKERDFRDRSRDRDNINANKTMERDKDRPMVRDRRDRDRQNRLSNKKRSLSPSPSVASSTGTASYTASSKSLGLNYLPKRHYEPCNIPKSTLVKNRYNSLELKSKLASSVHIPSDLKEVFYNVDFNLDLLDVPKPLTYKIINEKDVKNEQKEQKSSINKKSSTSMETTEKSEPEEKIKSKPEEKKQQEETVKNKDDEKKVEEQEVKVESQVASEDKIQTNNDDDEPINKTEQGEETVDSKKEEAKSEQETLMVLEEEKEKEEKTEMKDEETANEDIDMKDSKPEEKTEDVKDSKSAIEVESEKTEKEISVPPATVTKALNSEKEKESPSSESHSRGKNSANKPANHKFNVKVLLISLPSMAEIYERLFGAEFASVASYSLNASSTNQISNRNQVSHFHKLFSMLVSRNSNDGYSFIGGKFIKELDGYLSGTNEPNLVRTSIRIVWEQTGLNLSSCKQWSVISTFVYNRDNSLNPNECGYEITKIYFPDIWSALDSIYQPPPWKVDNTEQTPPNKPNHLEENKMETNDDEDNLGQEPEQSKQNEELKTSDTEENDSGNKIQPSSNMDREDLVFIKDVPNTEKKKYLLNVLDSINNYKVYELKNELEKMGIKFESRGKKEQLYQQLHKVVQDSLKVLDGIEPVDITIGNDEQIKMSQEDSMTVEGDESQIEKLEDNGNSSMANKRKLDQDKSPDQKEKQQAEEKNKENSNKKPKLKDDDNVENCLKNAEKLNVPALASNIKIKGNNLTLVSLHTTLDPHRFDQFELSVVSEFIRDSLTMHFVQYIYSSLVNQVKLQKPIVPSSSSTETRNNTMANYCHLAFSYFDKGHCGYMPSDDLNILLNMAGFPISKKCFNSLVSSLMSLANITVSASSSTILNERIVYIFFQEPSILIPRQVIYPTMAGQLSSSSSSSNGFRTMSDGGDQEQLVVERNGIQFNVEELIKQSVADQKLKVRLNDSLADCFKKIAQLENQITELDTKQRKMSAATGRQNDELCAVKRERDQTKTKYEQLKKFWLKATTDFNTMMKTMDKTATGTQHNTEDTVEQSQSKKSSGQETGNAPNPGVVEPNSSDKTT